MLKKIVIIFLNILLQIGINDTHAGENRITNGWLAGRRQFPSHAKLTLYNEAGKNFSCSGTVLSSRWVLTTADCLTNITSGHVVLGTTDLSNKYTVIDISKFIIHPEASSTADYRRDVGLIQLKEEIEFDEFIKPAQLPEKHMTMNYLTGMELYVCGFGVYNRTNRSQDRNRLRFTIEKVIPKRECAFKQKDIICAVSTIEDSLVCIGDSGSPFYFLEDSETYVVGIASIVYENCVLKLSGHESVVQNLDWIREQAKVH